MRTTIDIPDDLLRQAKVRAAERGIKLKDLFVAGLEKELESGSTPTKRGRREPIPVRIDGTNWTFPYLTNADLFEAMDREEK